MRHLLFIISLCMFLGGCATHPTISTTPMEKGEKRYGYSWAAENVFPYLWYRYGLTEKDDIGLRIGVVYGTGIDYSRILYTKDNKWDVLNLAWSMNPNYNTDFTYYKFNQRINKKDGTLGAISWWGLRMMYIPKGISGGTSTRIGFLMGGQPNDRWGYEIGYNHDFSSMPITNLFDFSWNDTMKNDPNLKRRYGDTPHTDPASGLPTEYSRLTGISFRVFVNLGMTSPIAAN